MHPYSKRPPPAEPLALGTGDFEAVSYPMAPHAHRAQVFHRSMAPQAQGYGFGSGGGYPAHYSGPPPAPHSLAPMAMSSVRDAAATGSHRVQSTVVIRSRPSVRTGSMILVAGALIGALCGVAMRARQNAADAAFAAQPAPQAEQQMALATQQSAPVVVAPNVPNVSNVHATVAAPQGPAVVPPQAYANVPFGSLVVSQVPAQPQVAPEAPHAPQVAHVAQATPAHAPPVAPVAHAARGAQVSAPPAPAVAPQPKAQPKQASWAKPAGGAHPSLSAKVSQPAKEKDDGYRVASATNDEPKAPPAAKAPKTREPAAEPKVTKREAKSSGEGEADRVLRAAMGATENTL